MLLMWLDLVRRDFVWTLGSVIGSMEAMMIVLE